MWRLNYAYGTELGIEIYTKPLKNLPKIVTTFLALFSDGNHRLTPWMESLILSYCACKISIMKNVWNCFII